MRSEDFLRLLNDLDSEHVESARKDIELYESSREGVSFQAEYSRKRTWKTVLASFTVIAAAMFSLFVLFNVMKNGFFIYPDSPYTSSEQSASDVSTPVPSESKVSSVSSASSTKPSNVVPQQPVEDEDGYTCNFDLSIGGDGDHRFSEIAEKTNERDYAAINVKDGSVSEESFVHMAVYGKDDFADGNLISETVTVTYTQKEFALEYTVPRGYGSYNYLCGWTGYYEASVSGRWDP